MGNTKNLVEPFQTNTRLNSKIQNSYPAIGILVPEISEGYEANIWAGIVAGAKKHHFNCISFCSRHFLQIPSYFDDISETVYAIAQKYPLEGLLTFVSLCNFIPSEQLESFLKSYSHIPIVSFGKINDTVPYISSNNTSGIRALLTHFIFVHRYRKIVFIRGPEGNTDAEERYASFKAVLSEFNIPVHPDLIRTGDFMGSSGFHITEQLLHERVEFEAIIAANDEMAFGAIQALVKNGVRVPKDIAVVGFDDIEEARFITPPLTTIRQPFYDMGVAGVEMLSEAMKEKKVVQNTVLDAKLIVRQSCGCFNYTNDHEKISQLLFKRTEKYQQINESELLRHITPFLDHTYSLYTRELVIAFCQSINGRGSDLFLRQVQGIGYMLIMQNKKLTAWDQIFFELWSYSLLHLDSEVFAIADDLLHKARIICAELAIREQGRRRIEAMRKRHLINQIGTLMQNAHTVENLCDTLCEQLPGVGIGTFFLSMFKRDQKESGGEPQLELRLACVDNVRLQPTDSWHVYPLSGLLPVGLIPADRPLFLVVKQLYFREREFGIVLFEIKGDSAIYTEDIREYISSSLHSALLIEQIQQQSEVMAQANKELSELREKEHAFLKMIKSELELGRKIQQGFLPYKLPQLTGLDMAVLFMPAREVSGDFYDVFQPTPETLALVIADVSGKDVSAALFMSLIRTLLRVFADIAQKESNDALNAIEVVNRYIIQNHRQNDSGRYMFATIFFGLLDLNTGLCRYINAGHNAPIIIRNQKVIKSLSSTGPAIGISTELDFGKSEVQLLNKDILFAYTDGVIESQNPAGDFIQFDQLTAILCRDELTIQDKIGEIQEFLKKHIDNALPFDDVTILAVQRH